MPCGMRAQPATLIQNPVTTPRRANNFKTLTPLQQSPADRNNPRARCPRVPRRRYIHHHHDPLSAPRSELCLHMTRLVMIAEQHRAAQWQEYV